MLLVQCNSKVVVLFVLSMVSMDFKHCMGREEKIQNRKLLSDIGMNHSQTDLGKINSSSSKQLENCSGHGATKKSSIHRHAIAKTNLMEKLGLMKRNYALNAKRRVFKTNDISRLRHKHFSNKTFRLPRKRYNRMKHQGVNIRSKVTRMLHPAKRKVPINNKKKFSLEKLLQYPAVQQRSIPQSSFEYNSLKLKKATSHEGNVTALFPVFKNSTLCNKDPNTAKEKTPRQKFKPIKKGILKSSFTDIKQQNIRTQPTLIPKPVIESSNNLGALNTSIEILNSTTLPENATASRLRHEEWLLLRTHPSKRNHLKSKSFVRAIPFDNDTNDVLHISFFNNEHFSWKKEESPDTFLETMLVYFTMVLVGLTIASVAGLCLVFTVADKNDKYEDEAVFLASILNGPKKVAGVVSLVIGSIFRSTNHFTFFFPEAWFITSIVFQAIGKSVWKTWIRMCNKKPAERVENNYQGMGSHIKYSTDIVDGSLSMRQSKISEFFVSSDFPYIRSVDGEFEHRPIKSDEENPFFYPSQKTTFDSESACCSGPSREFSLSNFDFSKTKNGSNRVPDHFINYLKPRKFSSTSSLSIKSRTSYDDEQFFLPSLPTVRSDSDDEEFDYNGQNTDQTEDYY